MDFDEHDLGSGQVLVAFKGSRFTPEELSDLALLAEELEACRGLLARVAGFRIGTLKVGIKVKES